MKKFMILLMALLVVTACKKDDDDDNNTPAPPTYEEKLVGTYVFTEGAFNQPVTMYSLAGNDTIPIQFDEGDDATQIVAGVLLGDSPCDNPANTAIEMKGDFSLSYVCIGESNESAMGTWTADEATSTIALNVNTDLGPIAIPIANVVIDDNGMSGNINGLPVPIYLWQPVGATNMQFVSVAVTFTKVN